MTYGNIHHHNSVDLEDIKRQFEKIPSGQKLIITTEKDAVRLHKFEKELSTYPIYALPIKHHFLFGGDDSFKQKVSFFINSFTT